MSLKKRLHSFKYAFAGIADLFRSQPNARIHIIVAFLVLNTGWYFNITNIEWSLLLICIALVLSMEAMNTAIEYLTDLVSPDYHPLAGKAKDVAAAAVLLATFGAILIGLIVFLPKVLILF
jgi:diacylglycerol kinase